MITSAPCLPSQNAFRRKLEQKAGEAEDNFRKWIQMFNFNESHQSVIWDEAVPDLAFLKVGFAAFGPAH